MRTTFAALVGASLMSLAACSGDDTSTASSTPTTATSAQPAAETTTEAVAPAGDAPADKDVCEAAGKADKAMKAELIEALKASNGEPTAADYKKVLTGLATQLTTAVGSSETEVGKAVKAFVADATEAANAADPVTAADNPEFTKAGSDLTAACKTAGVTVNY
ncbi:hypothetical protein JIG36_41230 [Actinoplanes sp. LDG1-06]|uniref:Lipoprotein n=1 Tax=Paractinoplanes ovalisporus TaxID=2810368 RepID=A0ABS2AQ01_9ACTN|nr:hypothetical protein [Actinoplanes ovalisporus]MBM2621944.1 hypothetical protein [Actinoplanes ovalisporus]